MPDDTRRTASQEIQACKNRREARHFSPIEACLPTGIFLPHYNSNTLSSCCEFELPGKTVLFSAKDTICS